MTDEPSARAGHVAPALGLLFLAPVTAEYLYGYDESTGNVAELVGGLVVFAPLYGGAALLTREFARHARRGWPTILLLGLAFGVLQAGLIDHSMFNPSYLDIEYWDEMFRSSHLAALGVNPNLALAFSIGHMIWSIAVPIAITEAIVPLHRTTPWLGNAGLAVTASGFVLAAAFVVWWHLDEEDFLPSAGQFAGAATVVIVLGVAAFSVPRRLRSPGQRHTVSPWVVGATALAIIAVPTGVELALDALDIDTSWWRHAEASWFLIGWSGFAWNLALLATLGLLVVRWSRSQGWGPAHHLAVAGGVLLANVITAFAAEPIGAVSDTAKYTHNTIGLLAVFALLAITIPRQPSYADAHDDHSPRHPRRPSG
jgi:hypothetical protein